MCITDRTVKRFREFERDKRGLDYQRATAKAVEIFFLFSIRLFHQVKNKQKLTKSHKMNKLVFFFPVLFCKFDVCIVKEILSSTGEGGRKGPKRSINRKQREVILNV